MSQPTGPSDMSADFGFAYVPERNSIASHPPRGGIGLLNVEARPTRVLQTMLNSQSESIEESSGRASSPAAQAAREAL